MEKTLTFTVEDALISSAGLSILSGAGLFKKDTTEVNVPMKATTGIDIESDGTGTIDLTSSLSPDESGQATVSINILAPIFIMEMKNGSFTGETFDGTIDNNGTTITLAKDDADKIVANNSQLFVDFYVKKQSSNVSELQIDAGNFAGFYYVEASTLFRDETTGTDMPAEITLPRVKIQSNFSFSMASSGDPSTFTFTMDAFPAYTLFDQTKKVLCVIQVIEDAIAGSASFNSVMENDNYSGEDGVVDNVENID